MLGASATGMANAEIAAVYHLSPPRVKADVSRIPAKLGARDAVQLVVIAYRCGSSRPLHPRRLRIRLEA